MKVRGKATSGSFPGSWTGAAQQCNLAQKNKVLLGFRC